MAKYVTQYGKYFFILRKIDGFVGSQYLIGDKITDEEYKKLYYSSDKREYKPHLDKNKRIQDIKIEGNAAEILGRPLNVIQAK